MYQFGVDQRRRLAENARILAADASADPIPVVRMFHPLTGWSWTLVSMHSDEAQLALGLTDMNDGKVEFGLVDLGALPRTPALGLGVEIDRFWEAKLQSAPIETLLRGMES